MNGHFWVFGYGSLMWNPGFEHIVSDRSRLTGLHRAPCIYSWVHRGTKQRPGIVLGLAPGGSCVGMAFKVDNSQRTKTIDYLRARELVTNVYVETQRNITLSNGQQVPAITYIADRSHEQFAGRLDKNALVAQISGAVGKSGPNEAYIHDTVQHLRSLGIKDALMESVVTDLNKLEEQ